MAAGTTISVVFTDQEGALIMSWSRDHCSGLPPGLAKPDRLPRGLEKQLRERATLPPGLQKKIHSLPPELDPQLRKLPAGYIRVIVGATVVLMNEETSTIFDCSC